MAFYDEIDLGKWYEGMKTAHEHLSAAVDGFVLRVMESDDDA